MTRDAKAGVGRNGSGAEGRGGGKEKARPDVSDVDVLLSLSRIIGRYPVSLTRVDVKRKKIVSARYLCSDNEQGTHLYVSRANNDDKYVRQVNCQITQLNKCNFFSLHHPRKLNRLNRSSHY